MQFTEPLQIWEAEIGNVGHKQKDGKITGRIQIKGRLTSELAEILQCKDVVYTDNETARGAFEEVRLDGGCQSFRALLEVNGLKQEIEINGDSVSDIVIDKVDNGALRVTMRLNYSGDPLPFMNYWVLVGGAQGICTISPLQKELEAIDGLEATTLTFKSKTGETQTIPLGKDALRQGLAAVKSKRVQ